MKRAKKSNVAPIILVPPNPTFLLAHLDDIEAYYPEKNRDNDHPLAALYRMYVAIMGGKDLWLRTELEAFFRHSKWTVSDIPDPKDTDIERYTVIAAITYLLPPSFNRLISKGLPRHAPAYITDEIEANLKAEEKKIESVPSWAQAVPAFAEPFEIPDGQNKTPDSMDDEKVDPFLRQKGILTTALPIYFV